MPRARQGKLFAQYYAQAKYHIYFLLQTQYSMCKMVTLVEFSHGYLTKILIHKFWDLNMSDNFIVEQFITSFVDCLRHH